MKIEKLTENKIRVIINSDDLEETNSNIQSVLYKALENKGLFLDILKRAEKEVGFTTDDCKLLIEAFSSTDDILVFTITKYSPNDKNGSNNDLSLKKKVIVKRKSIKMRNKQIIYAFDDFDTFCNFCCYITKINQLNIKFLAKNISLYLYKNTYYLVLRNIYGERENIKIFDSNISEFAKLAPYSDNFSSKLFEHGKLIVKNNAILNTLHFFAK